jgi:hypothetical protein
MIAMVAAMTPTATATEFGILPESYKKADAIPSSNAPFEIRL